VLFPFLVDLSAGHLVPDPQNVSAMFVVFHQQVLIVVSRHLFTVKAIVAPTAGITFFIWCLVKAGGAGPIIRQPATIHGSDLSWAMVVGLMSAISNMATLIT
jgi:cytosine/uracil/thiamine/allantoin permease